MKITQSHLKAVLIASSLSLSNPVYSDIVIETKDAVLENISKNYEFQTLRTKNNIWEIELNFFKDFFDINSPLDFVEKVMDIQLSNWLIPDWIIWKETLKVIYELYYINNPEINNQEILKRISIYNEMKWYSKIKKAISYKLNVFNQETYYWKNMWVNLDWTFLNAELSNKLKNNIENIWDIIYVFKIEWKTALAYYSKWKLKIASYVTWWKDNKTYKINTTWKREPDKLHYSSSYPIVLDEENWSEEMWWAVMPYATHVEWWIRLHWSDWAIDWYNHSKWCIRVPLFYMKEIYETVKNIWKENLVIDTTNIYNEDFYKNNLKKEY